MVARVAPLRPGRARATVALVSATIRPVVNRPASEVTHGDRDNPREGPSDAGRPAPVPDPREVATNAADLP